MDERLEAFRSILSTTSERWTRLARLVPDHLLQRQPLPGEWSAHECLLHLLNTERFVFPVRAQYFLDGKDLPIYDPDQEERSPGTEVTTADLATEFAVLRDASLRLLSGIDPQDLDRRANHEELGSVTLGEMLHEWAAHDLMHTVQAEQAMMQPFIQGSGPWKPFFANHSVRDEG